MGRNYTDRDVSGRALMKFSEIVKENDEKLFNVIRDNYEIVRPFILSKIHYLGLTDYANKLTVECRANRRSERKELLSIIGGKIGGENG